MTYTYTVTTPGVRCDSFLAATEPTYSRTFWAVLCNKGMVTVNGQSVKPSHKLAQNDRVEASVPDSPDFGSQTLPIIYEDSDVVVLNKPAGMLTHAKGPLTQEFTVAEFVRSRTTDSPDSNRPGIVHRLDRGTSGVIIAAKHSQAKRWLQKQFSLRKVKKTYIALVQGHPKEPAATLQLPIERNPRSPQTFKVSASGKPAETTYETLQVYPQVTLLKLEPRTGRTHQLRVHMHYIDCPIVGDEFYGTPNKKLGRLFLHAVSLELTLPNRTRQVFNAPLPPELKNYLDTLA